MEFLDIANVIIPGYASLSEKRRKKFEESASGQSFSKLIDNTLTSLKKLHQTQKFWSLLTGSTEKRKQGLHDTFEQQKHDLLNKLKDSAEYNSIIDAITINLLKSNFPDLKLLRRSQQKTIARAEFSKVLFTKIHTIDKGIKQTEKEYSNDEWAQINTAGLLQTQSLEKLTHQKRSAIKEWKKVFDKNRDMRHFRHKIGRIKRQEKLGVLNQRIKELGEFLPFLNYRLSPTLRTPLNKLRFAYAVAPDIVVGDPLLMEQAILSNFFFDCLKQLSDAEINFINLDAFNQKHAERMAEAILNAFNNNCAWDMDEWLNEYSQKLYKHLCKEMQSINGNQWQTPPIGYRQQWMNALSYLWNNKAVDEGNKFVSKLADAHAFIQATNFSTQNESSFLAILDFYNYGRYCEQISETKSILANLLGVFRPLYDEYKEIAFYEKNIYRKAFRTLMPLIITAAFIVLVAALLAPLAIPDLAFAVAFIPALIIGLALATQYVKVKNVLYNYFREKFYGGRYEIPEFQCNERMNRALSPTKAEEIRKFYIAALSFCDKKESHYQLKDKKGLLTQEEITAREENKIKRHQLCLEWYDIHSNNEVGFEQIPQIILARLQQTGDAKYQVLQNTFQEEQVALKEAVNTVTSHLKSTIEAHNNAPDELWIETSTIRTNYQNGFFSSPRGFAHKASLEKIATLKEHISELVQGPI